MKASFLKEMKKVLEARRAELLEDSAESLNGESQEVTNLPDVADLATTESDQSFNIRLKERERKLLAKINEALQRLDRREYGICEGCGQEISEGRLRARPVTTLCISCKTEQEELERRESL